MQGGNGGQQGLPGARDLGRGTVRGDGQTSLGRGSDHGEQRSHSVLSGKTQLCLQIRRAQESNPGPAVRAFSLGIHLGCCVLWPWRLAGLVSWTVIQVSGQLRPSSVYEPASRGLSCSSAGPGTSTLLSRWWPVRANMMCGALRTHESSQWPPWWELTSPSLCREGTRVTEVSGCQGHAVSRWRGLGLVPVGHRAQPSTARLCLSNERGTPLSSPVPASPPWPSGAQLPLGRLFLN